MVKSEQFPMFMWLSITQFPDYNKTVFSIIDFSQVFPIFENECWIRQKLVAWAIASTLFANDYTVFGQASTQQTNYVIKGVLYVETSFRRDNYIFIT